MEFCSECLALFVFRGRAESQVEFLAATVAERNGYSFRGKQSVTVCAKCLLWVSPQLRKDQKSQLK